MLFRSLLLNTALDSNLKHRYDKYRAENRFPPEAQALENQGIQPYTDLRQLNEWREKLSALRVVNEGAGYVLQGKIDDVLLEADGRLVPADYKSSGNAPAEDKQRYYVDQLTAYGLMFREHGHRVSDRAYLLHYFVADKSDPSLEVRFDAHVDLVSIDVAGIECKLADMVELLEGDYPGHNPRCSKCSYYEGRNNYGKE